MSEIQVRRVKRSLLKGMLAGLAGGVAAMAAKTVAERFYASRMESIRALAAEASGAGGARVDGG